MLSILGKRQTKPSQGKQAGEQLVYPGAICCMLVGEPWVDEQGNIRRNLCGAVATTAWQTTETTSAEGANAVNVMTITPLCAEHREAWRAVVTPDGVTKREVYPAGTFARWNAEANEQAQEIIDTLMATIAERLTDDLDASEAQVERVFQACAAALHARETAILKPQMPATRKRVRQAGKRGGAVKATQPVRLV